MDRPRDPTFWRVVKVIAILLAVAVVYWPSLRGDFVWDDEQLVTGNLLLRTVSGLGEIWSGSRTADFFPLTNTLFWIEWPVFGNNPIGYHVVNVVLQGVDALLVWLVLTRLRIPGAWLAGLIFAIHPINAESVAWISELKNVLAMFFSLLSIFCFFEIEDQRLFWRRAAWIGSICFYVLALLSKSQAVFVPVVLLICAWWRADGLKNERFKREAIRTWPFFIVGLALGLITIWFQNRGIGEEVIVIGSLGRRLANTGIAVWWYAAKVLVPVGLMVIYPSWPFGPPQLAEWLPLIGLVLAFILFWFWKNRPAHAIFFALACFVAALAPVLGLARMAYLRSGTLVADHFVYFSTVPLIALIAATISILWNRSPRFYRPVLATAVILAVSALGIYASTRAAVFRDEQTLWFDTLAKNPDAWQAHVRLGKALFDRQQFAPALPHLQRAVELRPELPDNRNLLGLDLCRLERFEEGIAEYREALRLKETRSGAQNSGVATIRTNLANALAITADNMSAGREESSTQAMERYREAVAQYEKALELEPRQPAIHRNLGMLLARLGRYDEAVAHLRTALEIVPNEPIAREMLNQIEARYR